MCTKRRVMDSHPPCPLARHSHLILVLLTVNCVALGARVRNPVQVDTRIYCGISIHTWIIAGRRIEMCVPHEAPTGYLSPEVALYHPVVPKPMDVETLHYPIDLPKLSLCQVDRSRHRVLENTTLVTRGGYRSHGIGDNLRRVTHDEPEIGMPWSRPRQGAAVRSRFPDAYQSRRSLRRY